MVYSMACSGLQLALFTALLASPLVAEEVVAIGWQSDANQAWQSAREAHRPLLLYISMQNCIYCRKMEHETLADEEIAADIQRQFIAASIASEDNAELVRKLQVRSFPATVIISPERGVIDHIRGYVSPRDLKARLDVAARRSQPAENPTR